MKFILIGSLDRLQSTVLKFTHISKNRIKLILRRCGIYIVNPERFRALHTSDLNQIVGRWSQEDVSRDLLNFIYKNHQKSYSQLQQDLVAEFYYLNLPKSQTPFFVEFGATDGVTLSNSYLLEKKGWEGLLAEPDKNWHAKLFQNRSALIDTRCIYSISGKTIPFRESEIGELSGIIEFADNDGWSNVRSLGTVHEVETVSLQDFLEQNHAPHVINFLSIDTEGSEFAIIEDFDFSKWDIRFVSIEHNFALSKDKITEKMVNSGYVQILPIISAWDAWFVKDI
jgi:FkbM family methyltransferase